MFTTKKEIERFLYGLQIEPENYTIAEDLSISVRGHVDMSNNGWLRIPVIFTEVYGDFNCSGNQITSLKGAPSVATGSFRCARNKLTSLEGLPPITQYLDCSDNLLTSLVGCPRELTSLSCDGNLLTSLEGGPVKVDGIYSCANNQLITLKGCPEGMEVFNCASNRLRSLEFGPRFVIKDMWADSNDIETLEFLPQMVGDYFSLLDNHVPNLELRLDSYLVEQARILAVKAEQRQLSETIKSLDSSPTAPDKSRLKI